MGTSATPVTLSRLTQASYTYMVVASIATVVAILQDRPAAFGGMSTGLPVWRDFVYGLGTALSPTLYWLIAQFLLTRLSVRSGARGMVGVIGLTFFGLVEGVGAVGEPVTYEVFNPATFDLLIALIQVGMIGVPLVMMAFGFLEWRRRGRLSKE